ncbi:MAG TPA: DUF6340 family protein [Bacteroidia bacterium]|nr:DUF6340 family protein [Bacteroidia bacterium]
MKRKHLYLIALAGLIIVLFSHCSSMRSVGINSMRPAEITFPSYVNTLLLVDRTKFEQGAVNIIEGILTGEMPGADKAAAQEAINALQQTLLASPRFKVIRASEIMNGNSITQAFPDALQWNIIEELCSRYKTEAIVALEIFDSNFIVTSGARKKKKTVEDKGVKKEIEVDEYYAEGLANVKIGIRLYDPKPKSIVDQQMFTKTKRWEATGNNITDAIAKLIRKTDATLAVSRMAGQDYAYKIAPMPVQLARQYYSKGKKTEQVAAGARRAEVNDWKGALNTWESALSSASAKDAARLCYNIAVAYEVLGDMENAKKYAARSYVDYGNKKGKTYSAMLEYRQRDEELSEQQMK